MSRRLLPLAGALVLLALTYRAFFSSDVPAARDLLYYFYPIRAHLAEALRAAEVPWLDRYRWGGLPLLAAPGAQAFHPATLLFLALPLGAAAKAWMLLHLALGALGFAALARRLGLTDAGAALAGLAFALAGPTSSLVPFLGASSAWALVPWVAAFALDVARAPSAKAVLPLAIAGGLLGLTAVPELLLHGAVVALVLAIPARGAPRTAFLRAPRFALLAAALGAGVAAVALLPAAASSVDTVRGPGGGTNVVFASQGALPPERLGELLFEGRTHDWTERATEAGYPYLPSIAPGRVALLLALLGAAFGRGPRLRAALLVALGLLLAVGPATPFFAAACSAFPPLATLRYPEKHFLLAAFGLALLTAIGIGVLERVLKERARRIVLPLLAVTIVLERDRVAGALLEMTPGDVVAREPALLASLPRAAPDAPPPRIFHRDSYAPVPAYDTRDIAASNRWGQRVLSPEYATLFGRAYLFELDYDLSLPREGWEWTRLLQTAIPQGGPLPPRLLRTCGIAAEERSERTPGGFVPRLAPVPSALPPYRFARRAVFDPDVRRLFGRVLAEGFAPDTAYVNAGSAPASLAVGRVLDARDRPSSLTLEVEVPAGGDGVLAVYRLRAATEEATIDAKPAVVHDLLFGFSALVVPPGRHVIRLRPDTRWVKIGASVTGSSLLVLIALLARSRRSAE